MPVKSEWLSSRDRSGFLAYPEKVRTPLPSVLVIQEVWGVDAHIEDVTRRIAASGYVAYAPDLLCENGERPAKVSSARIALVQEFLNTAPPSIWMDPAAREVELEKQPEPRRSQIRETYQYLFTLPAKLPALVPVLRDAVRFVQERPESRGQKSGCVGFCMGGGLTALLACEEPELSAAAIFYGSSPDLASAKNIACPVIGFYAGNDPRINAGVPAFTEAMHAQGKPFEAHTYDGAYHSFFNDTGGRYDVNAARDAWARLLTFFGHHLVT